MSTTVKYKGNTLATVDNATKTLLTAGKYMEADVVLTDVSSGGAGAFVDVVEQLPGGGEHHIITGVDISSDTVTAAHLETGYTAHDAQGNPITGTLSPSVPTLITKSITANGTYSASSDNADGYSSVTVNVPSGGGGLPTAEEKDVNFIDYDGTILYSYTASEAQALSALPANPSHSGLVAQGWNWTLAQIKSQLTNVGGKVWVGQMYITQSGDTEIDCTFHEGRLSPILTIAVNGTITVDWGDNTTPDTVTGTSLTTRQAVPHTYASTGDYMMKIHVVSGSFTFNGSGTYTLLRKNTTVNENRVYANCVQAVRLGGGVTNIGSSAFYNCHSLVSVSIPSGVTSIGDSAFYNCYSIASVTIPSGVTIATTAFYGCYSLASASIPSGVTSIGSNMFNNCYSIASVTIPSGVTSIGTNAFYNCYSIASVTIPSGVTSIGNTTFRYCYGVAEYHIKPTTPPALGTNAFDSIPSDCVIYVPAASLSDYQTATNWSTYASYMVGE